MFIHRTIQDGIENMLYQGKVMVLYGARRTGKTTLAKQILEKVSGSKYINCDLLQNQHALETTNSELLISFIGRSTKLVVFDEAQQIKDIGKILKILVDTFPGVQVIATGSSAFDLGNKVTEPLTGRSRVFHLFPLSYGEIAADKDVIYADAHLENLLRFGSYPEVFGKEDQLAIEELNNIASNYLYKDILQIESLRRTNLLRELLKAVAFQIGNEVSYNELANLLGENVHTVKKYLELLEKTFILFRLTPLSRNLRNEIGKGQKFYFYDTGIRNAIIQNFNNLSLRNDTGALWENFFISERVKFLHNGRKFVNSYFWRTYQQKEIDYIEETGGTLSAFECKFSEKSSAKLPADFGNGYPGCEFYVVNRNNYWKYLSVDKS